MQHRMHLCFTSVLVFEALCQLQVKVAFLLLDLTKQMLLPALLKLFDYVAFATGTQQQQQQQRTRATAEGGRR